ncbi:MAG: methylated-DNA--[protein]-cysteine S-methyltransferase [Halioglobus sp.]
MKYTLIETPIGTLRICSDGAAVTELNFDGDYSVEVDATDEKDAILSLAAKQLSEYFTGKRTVFDLPLAPQGTVFQQAVWKTLAAIPYGELRSYSDIAQQIGKPNAVRAVGAANGKNPLPIIVPCHRVIGRDGSLTGFAGGIEMKSQLLQMEGSLPA